MNEVLEDIIHGTLLGDACIAITSGKYFNYKHVAKDKRYLEWQSKLLQKHGISGFIGIDNKATGIHRLGFYINSKKDKFLDSLHGRWYKSVGGKNIKSIPHDIKITPTILLHWYLGDGCLVRAKGNRIPRIVLATNSFSKEDVEFLVGKMKDMGLSFYHNASVSGFKGGAKSGYVTISKAEDGTPLRFFKSIGMACPKEIEKCITGNKGAGSKTHYFRDKWPTEEDWLRIMSNVCGIGEILRKVRIDAGIGQAELARTVGCAPRHMRKIEKGQRFPSVPLFRKLLNMLGISTINLLNEVIKHQG